MRTLTLSNDWTCFYSGHAGKPGKMSVTLPHDFSITQKRLPFAPSGALGGFFQGADLVYERHIELPPQGLAVLEFEGVYNNAEVRLNGHLIHRHHYGYTGFLVDISQAASRDKPNRLKVSAFANARPDSRWYTGAGIYRPVRLHLAAGDRAIHPWGLLVETLAVEGDKARLRVRVDVLGQKDGSKLRFKVNAPDGSLVYEGEQEAAAQGESFHEFTLERPVLWSATSPALYTLACSLCQDGDEKDTAAVHFGVRTLILDAANGLRVNGQPIKLRGGCVHHDNGLLGAASYARAEERKVELLKAAGFNAVRCAHNPPSPAFLCACDRLGLYVMDEAFDVWQDGKTPYDYHTHFTVDWQQDIDAMVLRDRRHPSVIIWSTGNEIPERDGRLDGYAVARRLIARVQELDSSRPVTNCLNQVSTLTELTNLELNLLAENAGFDLWAARTEPFTRELDLVGYNYLYSRYGKDSEKFPGRVICGAESFPMEVYENWQVINALPHVIGDFCWTALDYLGEAGLGHVWRNEETGFMGSWPWHLAHCGDIDICGHKRPQSYYRDAVWGRDEQPCIAVLPPNKTGQPCEISQWGWPDVELYWDFPGQEGQTAEVTVYTSCDEVELRLNSQVLGRKDVDKCKATFEVPYEPGRLTAIGLRGGVRAGEHSLETAGELMQLNLVADQASLSGLDDLVYVDIHSVDDLGRVAVNARGAVTVSVQGGQLLALGAADPRSTEGYTNSTRQLYQGGLTAVVKGLGEGTVTVTATCEGLPPTILSLPCVMPAN